MSGSAGERVVVRLELAAGEQPSDPGADGGEDLRHVLIARWGRGVKGEAAWPSSLKTPSSTSVWKWMFKLEATGEALDHRHRAGLAVPDAVGAGGARVEGEERADIHAEHGAAQGVIPGEAVAEAVG